MPTFFHVAPLIALALMTMGCRSLREHPPVPLKLYSAVSRSLHHTDEPVIYRTGHENVADEGSKKPPENILVLSGGGMNGAFSAGMLNGWSQSGSRPQFDIVTGVSTGALIAPFAFLGERYDGHLKELYTSKTATQIYRMLPVFLWSESAASSDPLRRQIQRVISDDFVEEIAREHRRGRRLYIGTTNLDTQKLVVWDIGAIANGTDQKKRELIQNVMLASCSVPGLLPPVGIDVEIDDHRYSELHVDGGVSASMFLLPQGLALTDLDHAPPARSATVYTIIAAKADPDPFTVKTGLLQLSGASLSGVLRAQQENDLARIYLMARFSGARFQLAAVPADFPPQLNPMKFDLKTMRSLYDEGFRLGSSSSGWVDMPPGIDERKRIRPRTGVQWQTAQRESGIGN